MDCSRRQINNHNWNPLNKQVLFYNSSFLINLLVLSQLTEKVVFLVKVLSNSHRVQEGGWDL